jgi:hypothetical protein
MNFWEGKNDARGEGGHGLIPRGQCGDCPSNHGIENRISPRRGRVEQGWALDRTLLNRQPDRLLDFLSGKLAQSGKRARIPVHTF